MRLAVLTVLASSFAPAMASARVETFEKMVAREHRVGEVLRPFYVRAVMTGRMRVKADGRLLSSGAATEKLFQRVFLQLKREGKIAAGQPGRLDGVFVARDLQRFGNLLTDPNLRRVTVVPLRPQQIATYDRRHYYRALMHLEAGELAAAKRDALRYYTSPPRAGDKRAEPETVLAGGARVTRVWAVKKTTFRRKKP